MPVYLRHVTFLDTEEAQVSGHALDDAQLAVRDKLLLRGAVAHGEEHILVDRHDECLGRDAAKGRREVSPPVCRQTSPRCHFHAMHNRTGRSDSSPESRGP